MKSNEKIEYNDLITRICNSNSLNFASHTKSMQDSVINYKKEDFLIHLTIAGIIPENFQPDSTEEKIYAKYCDILLSRAFQELGLTSEIISERSDAADVIGIGHNYKIVADAKAFRLSRTAKNQKDFKVKSLDTWKKGANFACLVCPLYQYPTKKKARFINKP